mmetsp:Transcript_27656/g.70505  ORF Transcript_27656/g.70505 Transcript_27656/m.70505 type:complete len:297 (-) Transcript_27656:53-943(-)
MAAASTAQAPSASTASGGTGSRSRSSSFSMSVKPSEKRIIRRSNQLKWCSCRSVSKLSRSSLALALPFVFPNTIASKWARNIIEDMLWMSAGPLRFESSPLCSRPRCLCASDSPPPTSTSERRWTFVSVDWRVRWPSGWTGSSSCISLSCLSCAPMPESHAATRSPKLNVTESSLDTGTARGNSVEKCCKNVMSSARSLSSPWSASAVRSPNVPLLRGRLGETGRRRNPTGLPAELVAALELRPAPSIHWPTISSCGPWVTSDSSPRSLRRPLRGVNMTMVPARLKVTDDCESTEP